MKSNVTKYVLSADSRVDESVSMEIKHQSVVEFLKQIDGEFGIGRELQYPAPKFGTDITAIFSLYKKMGKGIKGDVMYSYRRLITDHHSCNDRIWIDFKAEKVSFTNLINPVVKKYIQGFNAYTLSIYPEALIYLKNDVPFSIRSKINHRTGLDFFYPFHYMDDILIKNVFGYTGRELFDRLQAANILAEELEHGIYFKAGDKIIDLEEAINFNKRMQDVLKVSLPIIN